jgi:septal ring-binding cell division protein DamX
VVAAPRLPVARQREDLPLVQPPARRPSGRGAPSKPSADEPELATRPGSPGPSKSDLEALDTLLNSRGLEAPLKGAVGGGDSGPQPVRRPTWEPSFGRAPVANRGAARAGATRGSLPLVIAGLVLLVALGLGAAWWFLVRPQPRAQARPTPAPAATPVAYPSTASPIADGLGSQSPAPAPSPLTTPSAPSGAPTPAPALAPSPSLSSPAPARASDELATARTLLQRGDLPAASRAFANQFARAPRGSHSIQLLVACAPETIAKALTNVGSEELYVLPVRYQKRDCYRLCWGLYANRAQAESARRGVPAYFRSEGAVPKVLSVPELRP